MKVHFKVFVFTLLLTIFTNVFAMQCVEYCQQNGFPDISGNAWQWWDNSASKGYIRGSVPDVGAVLVFKATTLPVGHVAIVASIVSNGEITVNHANWSNPPDGQKRFGQKVVDVSGGSWTKVRVNDSPTIYDTYGFIYRKDSSLSSVIRSAPLSNGKVYWRTKNLTDLSCENAQAWLVEDNDKAMSYETDASVCPKTCNSSAMNDSLKWLDFFIKPVYAGLNNCATTVSSMPSSGSAPEASHPYPLTGGTSTGSKPNLTYDPTRSYVVNAAKAKVTTLHINEPAFCRMEIKNTSGINVGAFKSQCFISDGNKIDSNPDDEGTEDTTKVDKGSSKTESEDFIAPQYPGTYNMVWCPDSSKQILETNEGDNCQPETVFTVWSSPNVLAINIIMLGGKTVLLPGEAYSVDTTIVNNGENFGKDIKVGWYLTGPGTGGVRALLETDNIRKENLKGGVSKVENLSAQFAPETEGMYTLESCPDDGNHISETNEFDNCISMLYEVKMPRVYTPPVIPIITSCPIPPDPDFNTLPTIPNGDVGAVIFGNSSQRIFLPVATLAQAKIDLTWGGFAGFDPSLVTKLCWDSDVTYWGIASSTACATGFTLQGNNWIADIPNTPQASKGTWSFKQGDTEYWIKPDSITDSILDTDGHIRYHNWTPNTVTVSDDVSGMTLNASFGTKSISGFWLPAGGVLNGTAFWNNDQDNYPGMPGVLECDASGKLKATIANVAPASTGRIILGLTTVDNYGWQTTTQWILPTGSTVINADGDYKLPTSASPFQKREALYDKGQQKLTLTINGDARMINSFFGITSINQVTTEVWFSAWMVPTGQASKLIKGTIARSMNGVWTLVFTGLPPDFGGSAYITLPNGVQGWQDVSKFAFGSGIVVDVNAGNYRMPK